MTKMNERVKFIGFKRHCIATDGEGVTTLAAFWGCPLRCKYCLNPQSLREETKCTEYTPEELYERVKIDDLYFVATRGGVTFGGGEPLLQTDFIESFRSLCGDRWRIYAETSLNVPAETHTAQRVLYHTSVHFAIGFGNIFCFFAKLFVFG